MEEEERRKKLELEKEARALEVHHGLHPFRWNTVLTPSQMEKRQRDLEREGERKVQEKLEVCHDSRLFWRNVIDVVVGGKEAARTRTYKEGK